MLGIDRGRGKVACWEFVVLPVVVQRVRFGAEGGQISLSWVPGGASTVLGKRQGNTHRACECKELWRGVPCCAHLGCMGKGGQVKVVQACRHLTQGSAPNINTPLIIKWPLFHQRSMMELRNWPLRRAAACGTAHSSSLGHGPCPSP